MKSNLFLIALLAVALLGSCSRKEPEQAASGAAEKHEESRVKHGTNGQVIVTLDAATQKLMGLQSSPLQAARLNPEAKGYGRVLDASSLGTVVGEMVAANSAAEASQGKLKR